MRGQQINNIPTSVPRLSHKPVRGLEDQNGMNMLLGLAFMVGGGILLVFLFTGYKNWKAARDEKKALETAVTDADKIRTKMQQKVANGGVAPVKSTPMPAHLYSTLKSSNSSGSGTSTTSSSLAPSPVPKAMKATPK
jgi:hypothetical protein